MFNGRRQPSRGGTSRMTRECQVRICERLGVRFPGPNRKAIGLNIPPAFPLRADEVIEGRAGPAEQSVLTVEGCCFPLSAWSTVRARENLGPHGDLHGRLA